MASVKTKTMKSWWLSKTLYLNVLAALALFLQSQYGYMLSPELQGMILAVINLVLRSITKHELV